MSPATLRLVEAAYGALEDRGLEAFADYWADDIEWQAIGGRFRGGDAGRAYLQEWFTYFEDLTVEAHEFIDVGNDRVVVGFESAGARRAVGSNRHPRTSPRSSKSETARSLGRWSTRHLQRPSKLPRQVAGASVEDH